MKILSNVSSLGFLALALFAITGCAQPQGDDRLERKAKIDAENQADADRKAQDERAKTMEAELSRVQNFYQGVRGTYEGKMKTARGSYRVRLSIHPNIEKYEGERVRTADEIKFDLQNLAFDVAENTMSRLSDGSDITFTCGFEGIRPGVDEGFFMLEGDECTRTYSVHLARPDSTVNKDARAVAVESREIAQALLNGEAELVTKLQVEWRSTNLPDGVLVMLERAR